MSGDPSRQRLIRWSALAIGAVLFCVSVYYVNFRVAAGTIRTLGVALPLALIFSGLWHLARTWAWAWCFPQPRTVSFARLARVRLAAEAFSYLTLRGIAGEPLKVVLLADRVDPREATAAVALERIAYIVGTTMHRRHRIADRPGRAAAHARLGSRLPRIRDRLGRGRGATALVVAGRGTYFLALLRAADRGARHERRGAGASRASPPPSSGRFGELVRGNAGAAGRADDRHASSRTAACRPRRG